MEGAHYLSELLLSRLVVTRVMRQRYKPGLSLRSEVIETARLILVTDGQLAYNVDDESYTLSAGMLCLVPPWVRRGWQASGIRSAQLFWCEFAVPAPTIRQHGLLIRSCQKGLELSALRRMSAIWTSGRGQSENYQMEGELKAMLGRFFGGDGNRAQFAADKEGSAMATQGIQTAVTWLEDNFRDPNALRNLHRRAELSPHYFRRMFMKHNGLSPGAYLLRLRMRYARACLSHSSDSIKEISQQLGYEDALYFSRLYRRFWGCSPSTDRARFI
ncbi:MAG TPA: AraC family transcriptional regulator [Candidatus Methylacidiphilales bacterium]|nr:AraC family transcriptional regulator [Candidatus Methylacidiphilales bacterium]